MKRSTLLLIIYISVAALVTVVVLSAQVAPIFTASIGGIFSIAFLFILTEQMFTHDAVEFENRFWTLMAFVLARTLIFCQDSPLRFPVDRPYLGWVTVVGLTFLAHNYERHLRRLVLCRLTNIPRMRSADFGTENRTMAQTKVIELRKLITIIDHEWLSSTFLNVFFLPRVLYVEHSIITIFSEANSHELNLIISSIQLALIFYKVKDHKIAHRFNRTKLLNILAIDRVSELNTTAKAMLLDALQRMKLSAHPQAEIYVKNIILKTKNDDLSELKSLTDSKGDINSMHKLIYQDIRSQAIKRDILRYIADQARVQAAHNLIKTKAAKQRNKYAWRKIFSDVDDTLSCSAGSWPAGMDISFPKKAIYPGVLAFYRELDLGVNGSDTWENNRIGNLVFLSARPHVYRDMSENVTYSKMKDLQAQRRLYTSPTLLAGSLDTGGQFMYKNDIEPLAVKKFDNFKEYISIYPEYTCVFIGDNGQGDVRCGEMILAEKNFSANMERIYIHQVQPLHLTYAKEEKTKQKQDKNSKICYFGTYIDAAIDAYHNKLIKSSGLRRVMEEAVEDFNYIPVNSWSLKPVAKTKPQAESKPSDTKPTDSKAITAAGNSSGTDSGTDTTDASTSNKTCNPTTATAPAPTSTAIVKSTTMTLTKPSTLLTSPISTTKKALNTSLVKATRAIKDIKKVSGSGKPLPIVPPSEANLHWAVKRELRIRELNVDIERGNAVLKSLKLPPVRSIEFPERFATGSAVQTLFGSGHISNFRMADGIYEVAVNWIHGGKNHMVKVYLPGIAINTKP